MVPEIVPLIPGAEVASLGVAVQHTLDEEGNRIKERRETHDFSFPPPEGESINDRVIDELLHPCIHGRCLLRQTHQIHRMQLDHPNKKILAKKLDIDAAYRRNHVSPNMAVKSITMIGSMAYILTRLPFGSKPAPSVF